MHALAILLCGYSLFSAVSMALTHFRCENYRGQVIAQTLGLALLLALASLQLMHFLYLQYGSLLIYGASYRLLLFAVAPLFYLFSKPILRGYSAYQPRQLLHFLPMVIAGFLPHGVLCLLLSLWLLFICCILLWIFMPCVASVVVSDSN